jgi:hypothetical protein
VNLVRQTTVWSVRAAAPACLFGYLLAGWQAAAGISIGTVLVLFEVCSFYLISQLLAPQPASPNTYRLSFLFIFTKLPLIGIAVYAALRLGSGGLAGFLFAIALVYSCMVYVALRDSKAEERDQFS